MTLNSYNESKTILIKEYPLDSDRRIQITSDEVEGIQIFLIEDGKRKEILPINVSGIPKDLYFQSTKLVSYLEDTYAKPKYYEGGSIGLCISHRWRGGVFGKITRIVNKITNHHQGNNNNSPPPPPPTFPFEVVFPEKDFLISTVEREKIDLQCEESGGKGCQFYKAKYVSKTEKFNYPKIKITVLKNLFHSKNIKERDERDLKASNLYITEQKCQSAFDTIKYELNLINLELNTIQEKIDNAGKLPIDLEYQIELAGKNIKKLEEYLIEIDKEILEDKIGMRRLLELMDLIDTYRISVCDSAPFQNFCKNALFFREKIKTVDIDNYNDLFNGGLFDVDFQKLSLLEKTVIIINQIIQSKEDAKEKDVVALFGFTGAGKSTVTNHLLGVKLQKIEVGNHEIIDFINEEQNTPKIGHSSESETLLTHIYKSNTVSGYVLADTGGLEDSRGIGAQIAVLSSLNFTLRKANSVKMILCCTDQQLSDYKSGKIKDLVQSFFNDLLKNYNTEEFNDSVLFMLTQNKNFINKEDVKKRLDKLSELQTKESSWYKFLGRENGKYIWVCNPVSDEQDKIISILNEMKPIVNKEKGFNLPFTTDIKNKVGDDIDKIAIKANALFSDYVLITENLNNARIDHVKFNEQLVQAKDLQSELKQITENMNKKGKELSGIESDLINAKEQTEKARNEANQFALENGIEDREDKGEVTFKHDNQGDWWFKNGEEKDGDEKQWKNITKKN
jgi:energy-coupling factor transporter ATP-binding protein EcfA2